MRPVLEVKALHCAAIDPTYGSSGAIGLDLYASAEEFITPGEVTKVSTGIAVAIPEGYYGRIAPRSGLAGSSRRSCGRLWAARSLRVVVVSSSRYKPADWQPTASAPPLRMAAKR